MDHDLLNGSRTLEKGRLRRLALHPGDRIECLSGCLWLTQDGDLRDIVIGPGEAHVVDRDRPTLLSALETSRYIALARG